LRSAVPESRSRRDILPLAFGLRIADSEQHLESIMNR
jgi:hypothetical protein